jgi:hypothetical protein
MVNKKVTPAIEKFISSNCTLTPNAISGIIFKRFKIEITGKALQPYVERARAETAAINNAKVEAVRAKILESGDLRAEKYLKYLDDNVEALHNLIINAKDIKIEDVKDLVAVSNSLQKSLCAVLDFVKPPETANVSVTVKSDLSRLSIDQLRQLRAIKQELEGDRSGTGEAKTP